MRDPVAEMLASEAARHPVGPVPWERIHRRAIQGPGLVLMRWVLTICTASSLVGAGAAVTAQTAPATAPDQLYFSQPVPLSTAVSWYQLRLGQMGWTFVQEQRVQGQPVIVLTFRQRDAEVDVRLQGPAVRLPRLFCLLPALHPSADGLHHFIQAACSIQGMSTQDVPF